MPELYALADLMVLPSHGEGLPLGVQEAMLSGASVVVSDDPAFRDGLTGMPGVRFARTAEELLAASRLTLASPTPRAWVREAAAARWGLEPFLDAYERARVAPEGMSTRNPCRIWRLNRAIDYCD
ncbi:MAG: glycosyltransferase family 4 protein [Myxococcales bacterium]|nr:glycosyltransferase family 4 protein [Myxococcales bacterium]